ncbi:hypothetical protein [Nocardia sp. NBC_01327]|uniref:hypothetical protein n=1 Tax=Nocardia sp. NBC_01327 TaxID=2903593 RepID=UPI002E0D3B07|nr:hypothetical protein OG326_34555 [Nocardia sp. NBC_01327]
MAFRRNVDLRHYPDYAHNGPAHSAATPVCSVISLVLSALSVVIGPALVIPAFVLSGIGHWRRERVAGFALFSSILSMLLIPFSHTITGTFAGS